MDADMALAFGQDIVVNWDDSAVAQGWQDTSFTGATGDIHTCATVVHVTAHSLTVAQAVDKDTHAALAPLTIPWGCITKVTKVGG